MLGELTDLGREVSPQASIPCCAVAYPKMLVFKSAYKFGIALRELYKDRHVFKAHMSILDADLFSLDSDFYRTLFRRMELRILGHNDRLNG